MPALAPLHRNRHYQRLWLAHALSGFGSQASYIALPLALLAQTGSTAAFGTVTAVEIVAGLLAGLLTGPLVDRLPRRPVLITCDLGRTLAFAALTWTVATHQLTLVTAVTVTLANAAFSAPFQPAASAALRHVVDPAQLTTAVSLAQARSAAVTLAGPLLGAALYTLAPTLPFAVDAVSFLLSAALLAGVPLPTTPPARPEPAPTFVRDLSTGWREVRRSPFLRYTLTNAALVNFAFSGIILVLLAGGSAHGHAAGLHNGLLIAASGAGNLLGSLVAPRAARLLAPRTLVLTVCWASAALTPLLAMGASPVAELAVIAACSIATPAANAVISAARLHTVPDHLQGRVQTACGIIPALVVPLGPLATGFALGHAPAAVVIVGNSALLAVLALYSTSNTGLRRIPDLRPKHDAPHAPTADRGQAAEPEPATDHLNHRKPTGRLATRDTSPSPDAPPIAFGAASR